VPEDRVAAFLNVIRREKPMQETIHRVRSSASADINACHSPEALEAIRVKLFGRKGEITALLRSVSSLPPDQRPAAGKALNALKTEINDLLVRRHEKLGREAEEKRILAEKEDVTLPGVPLSRGSRHPIARVMQEIIDIFSGLGFAVEEGPEVESDYFNFQALNFPADHPARDMQDTIYVSDRYLLRTHTSPVQIRVMQRQQPPLRCIMPGRVYRCDYDVSHSPMFHQVEGLYLDRDVTFSQLKGILTFFVRRMFGAQTALRFRSSFFPFTEPSAEIDIACVICAGKGCRVCGSSGWLEILGAGMVHPEVIRAGGHDPKRYSGYAFGMGVERVAMLKYGIDDIRLFFDNDVRFLNQFKW
jgi:phenylalanyl-tRNA synthetase alpha chain